MSLKASRLEQAANLFEPKTGRKILLKNYVVPLTLERMQMQALSCKLGGFYERRS
jgi:hypothetical protein